MRPEATGSTRRPPAPARASDTARAPCTHAKEGTGYGAVDAHVGALWYADALGRVATSGVRVFARQTLIGGVYGLLGTTTDNLAPTPGYWVAVLHKRLMGTSVLSVKAHGPEGFSAYASTFAPG